MDTQQKDFASLSVAERIECLKRLRANRARANPASTGALSPGASPTAPVMGAQPATGAAATGAEELGVMDYVTDTVKGVGLGVTNAIVETGNLLPGAINMFRDEGNKLGEFSNPLEDVLKLKTGWGEGVKTVSQFIAGMVGAGKILKAGKLLQGTTKATKIGRSLAEGGLADFSVFDAHEKRLSNLIEDSPLANHITDYLAANKDDSIMEGKFKNLIEGMALGVVGEALFLAIKGTKAMRHVKTVREAEDIMEATGDSINALAVKHGKDPEKLEEAVDAVITGETRAVDEVAEAAAENGGKLDVEVHGTVDGRAVDEVLAGTVKADAKVADEVVDGVGDVGGKVADDGAEAVDEVADGVPKPTPGQKGRLTRSLIKPEEMEDVMNTAFNTPEKGLEFIDNGEFFIANNRRINVDDFEEVTLHGEYALRAWEKTLKGKGVEAHKEVFRKSEEIVRAAIDDDLLAMAATDDALMRHLTARLFAYKMAAQSLGKEMLEKWLYMEVNGKNPQMMGEFHKLSEAYQKLSITAKNIGTTAARATASGKMSPKYIDDDVMGAIIKGAGADPEKVAAVLNAHRRSRWDTAIEYVLNGLLSNPITHVINTSGNLVKTLLMPMEKIIGSVKVGDKSLHREGIETYAGLTKFYTESWKAAKMVLETGENTLDKSHRVIDGGKQPKFTTYEKIKTEMLNKNLARGDKSGKLGPGEDLLARFYSYIGFPTRALGTMDEFFKQINYRAHTYAKLMGEATAQPGLTAEAMAEFVEKGMREAFGAGGQGIRKDGLRYSQEATWTQPLRDGAYFNGGVGQAALTATNSFPPLKLVMPFVRTPTNLIRDFVAHTPGLNMVTKRYRDAVAAGGEQAAHAYGQMATGGMLWISAIGLAVGGKMTGGYPRDPATRQAWMDAGIEPYSFKIGDKYISFARMDPFSTMFGLAADYAEYSRNWSDSVKGNFASGAIIALSNNLMSKSYLTGLSDLINAVGDNSTDSHGMERFINRAVTMLVPLSSGMRFARHMTDDSLREVRSWWDSIYNTIPGTSYLLPERRSWITGKAISHNLMYGDNNNDIVTNELARLGDNLEIGPPAKRLSGVELDAEQYSRLCELHGTVKINGKTLHDSLGQLMKSGKYDIDRKRMADMPGDEANPRTDMVKKLVSAYRKKAQKSLLSEHKELQNSVQTQLRAKIAAKNGNADRYKELLTPPKR